MNRRLAPLALLLLALTPAACHAQRVLHSVDFRVSHRNFADTITVGWEERQVIVPVEMGGRQYRFLLDTGSGHVVYADTAIDSLQQLGTIRSIDATGRADTVPLVTLPPLRIGGLTLTGCQATVHRRPPTASRIDGVLGFDLFAKTINGKIDVAARRLILSDRKGFFDREGGHTVRYRLKHYVPYLDISPFAGYSEPALFDTGSPNLYRMNRQSYEAARRQVPDTVARQTEGETTGRYAIGLHGTEPRGSVAFLCLTRLQLGTCRLAHLHTLTTQGGSHVGAALLDLAAVVINPRRRQLRLQPYDGHATQHIDNEQTAIAFVSDGGRPAVGLVWPGGEAYRQGFREGDIIVRIDGRPVTGFTAFSHWHFERGREHVFTVKDRRGFQREIRWVAAK